MSKYILTFGHNILCNQIVQIHKVIELLLIHRYLNIGKHPIYETGKLWAFKCKIHKDSIYEYEVPSSVLSLCYRTTSSSTPMERSQMSTATVQDSTCTSRSSGRGLFHELKTHRKHNIYIYLSSASTSLSGLFPPPCRTPNGLKLFRKLLGSAKIDHSTAVPACFA